jgi:hypothetical protein
MKWLVTLIVVAGLLLVGCPQPTAPPTAETPPPTPPPELYDKTWISPGKVEVGNFYPGARAEYMISVHNGSDEPAEFSITFQIPGSPAEGFDPAPAEAESWITIEDPAPVLAAKATREVLIVLEMPDDAQAPPKWEFRIAAKDVTQTGMVQTELACRWLVVMK